MYNILKGSDNTRADLHIHSTHSDGDKNLSELIEFAKLKNVDIIGITDHDNIGIVNDIEGNEEIKVIIGTEYSTMYNGENVHLLGYYMNNKPSEDIIKYLNKLEEERTLRAKEMLNKLDAVFDIKLDYDELNTLAKGSIGRPHIAKLINKKYGIGIEEVFRKMIGDDAPCFIPSSEQDLISTIKFIKNNGGIAVIAHPIHYKNTTLEEFIDLDIDGIECFYPEHKKKYTKKLVELCKKHNLVITGGSDFHNIKKFMKHGMLGDFVIEDEYIELFLERIGLK